MKSLRCDQHEWQFTSVVSHTLMRALTWRTELDDVDGSSFTTICLKIPACRYCYSTCSSVFTSCCSTGWLFTRLNSTRSACLRNHGHRHSVSLNTLVNRHTRHLTYHWRRHTLAHQRNVSLQSLSNRAQCLTVSSTNSRTISSVSLPATQRTRSVSLRLDWHIHSVNIYTSRFRSQIAWSPSSAVDYSMNKSEDSIAIESYTELAMTSDACRFSALRCSWRIDYGVLSTVTRLYAWQGRLLTR